MLCANEHRTKPTAAVNNRKRRFMEFVLREHHAIEELRDACRLHLARLQLGKAVAEDVEAIAGTEVAEGIEGVGDKDALRGEYLHSAAEELLRNLPSILHARHAQGMEVTLGIQLLLGDAACVVERPELGVARFVEGEVSVERGEEAVVVHCPIDLAVGLAAAGREVIDRIVEVKEEACVFHSLPPTTITISPFGSVAVKWASTSARVPRTDSS